MQRGRRWQLKLPHRGKRSTYPRFSRYRSFNSFLADTRQLSFILPFSIALGPIRALSFGPALVRLLRGLAEPTRSALQRLFCTFASPVCGFSDLFACRFVPLRSLALGIGVS